MWPKNIQCLFLFCECFSAMGIGSRSVLVPQWGTCAPGTPPITVRIRTLTTQHNATASEHGQEGRISNILRRKQPPVAVSLLRDTSVHSVENLDNHSLHNPYWTPTPGSFFFSRFVQLCLFTWPTSRTGEINLITKTGDNYWGEKRQRTEELSTSN